MAISNLENPNDEMPELIKKRYTTPSVQEFGSIGGLVKSGATGGGVEGINDTYNVPAVS